ERSHSPEKQKISFHSGKANGRRGRGGEGESAGTEDSKCDSPAGHESRRAAQWPVAVELAGAGARLIAEARLIGIAESGLGVGIARRGSGGSDGAFLEGRLKLSDRLGRDSRA